MARFIALTLGWLCPAAGIALALEFPAWENQMRRFDSAVTINAPEGITLMGAPESNAVVVGHISDAPAFKASAFVEAGGDRYYITAEALEAYYDSQKPPVWFNPVGQEILPPLPELVQSLPAIHPDTGENIIVDVYKESVDLAETTSWPLPPQDPYENARRYTARVASAEAAGLEGWKVNFVVYANPDAIAIGYPFHDLSMDDWDKGIRLKERRLISSPSNPNHTLSGTGNSANILGVLKPGCVFNVSFDEHGRMRGLSAGTDAFIYENPCSRLGHAAFLRENGLLAFRFKATTMTASPSLMRFTPNRISGADYTKYDLIENLGFPFDEATVNSAEYATDWVVDLSCDQSIELIAPLYDGRGAPGMIELEGLQLDGAPVAAAVTMTRDEFADLPSPEWEAGELGPEWGVSLRNRIGPIPASQRVPEVLPY